MNVYDFLYENLKKSNQNMKKKKSRLLIFNCNCYSRWRHEESYWAFIRSVQQWWIYNNWQILNRLDTWQQT